MADPIALPQGFVLESPAQSAAPVAAQSSLPPGFEIEQPAPQAATAPAAQPADPGFFARIGERLAVRGENLAEITAAPPETNVESLEKGLQVLGQTAGGALDVAGEAVMEGVQGFNMLLSAITPDVIEDPIVSATGDALEAIVGTDTATAGIEAASKGIEAYQAWAAANPRASKNIDALANIALVAAPVPKGTPRAPGPTAVGRAGEAVGAAAERQTAQRTATFLDDLITPKSTKAVREAEILRSAEGGLVTGRTVTPSASETAISSAVGKVEGVTPSNTLLQNLNAVQQGISTEAKALTATLEASPVKIARQEIKRSMSDVATGLAANPLLVGDAARTGARVISKAQELMAANPNTPAGVFKARQQFDAWVKSQKPKIFDPNTESALSIAVRETRQGMNDIVASSVPSAGVRESLAQQSNLFRALDNIGPKAVDEASTVIGRLGQRVANAVGLKRSITQNLPQITTAAALGGGASVAPGVVAATAITAGVGLGAAKLIMSPAAKKAVSGLLSQTDKAIRQATKNGNTALVQQLRADRAAVIEATRSGD